MIAAPSEKVYAAFVDADALKAWLPPAGMSGRFERFDPYPGGSYRMVLTYGDAPASGGKATADSDIVEARYIDMVPGIRVVQAVDFVSDDPADADTMTMSWEFTRCRWRNACRHQSRRRSRCGPPGGPRRRTELVPGESRRVSPGVGSSAAAGSHSLCGRLPPTLRTLVPHHMTGPQTASTVGQNRQSDRRVPRRVVAAQ